MKNEIEYRTDWDLGYQMTSSRITIQYLRRQQNTDAKRITLKKAGKF